MVNRELCLGTSYPEAAAKFACCGTFIRLCASADQNSSDYAQALIKDYAQALIKDYAQALIKN